MWVISTPAYSPAVEALSGLGGAIRGPMRNNWVLGSLVRMIKSGALGGG